VVPGVEGEFTVLPGHAPVISALRPGVVDATLGDARTLRVFVKGGFAEVDADRLIVLAERAMDVESMDAAGIAAELQSAEAELAAATQDAAHPPPRPWAPQAGAVARNCASGCSSHQCRTGMRAAFSHAQPFPGSFPASSPGCG
jgi:ATP synthase F1 epsilon subunit